MAGRDTTGSLADRLRALHGVFLAILCSVFAELLFGNLSPGQSLVVSAGRTAIVFLALITLHRFAVTSLRGYKPELKDLLTLCLLIYGTLLLAWTWQVIGVTLAEYSGHLTFLHGIAADSLFFAIPFASGALVLQAIRGLHFGLMFTLCLALITGVYLPGEPTLVPFVLATSLVACLSLSRFRSRSAYIKAGFNVALVALPFALASTIIAGDREVSDVTLRILGALAGGILCTFIASGITPLLEYLGGYVTDMRLIEMATLDHPLLKDLSIQAPGTWNHSMVMGMMAESAAVEIGANPVVARVGAYFHDIGKVTKPLYFVENQNPGENRHDRLSTSMSALIIRSHVKEGIELAREHKLPQVIVDLIPQHHGTARIEYFYDKACREAREAGGDPDEVDPGLYSYPGPKPQTREAAILMLADGIEAAARTLSEPNLDRIQGLVQKMINKVFASGELDECEITLQDLHHIAKTFTRILSGIYHQRIAYAEPAEKVSEPHRPEEPTGPQPEDEVSEQRRAEDLKRLGM